jgi:DNA primase
VNPSGGIDYKTQVLAATDIVQLIGQTVALKRRGKSFVGLCPFHQEKTGSFHVDSAKQFFYCFGCKASGNAIDFVMKHDRIEFKEALRLLGQQAGIDMPEFGGTKQKSGERQALLDAHSAACAFFEKLLAHKEHGQPAREYLVQRGINAESIQRFQIGFAMESWDALLQGLSRKFTPQQLASAGLVKVRERGGGFYDTFRNRLMFPIRDESGRVIAFGGREMPGSESPPKYLNSPETPLFSKGRCIFGIDLARQRIVETRTVAIVEGYTDTVMAHQFGVSNVVSVLGTAMTEDHLTMLRRFADRIVLLFDPDSAGDTAVDRALELFLRQPIEIAIASLPDGMDPDEFLLKNGAEAFEKVLANATDALSFKWRQLTRRFTADADDLTGQQKAVEEYLSLLASARASGPVDAMRWGSALTRVSRLTEIPVEELNRRFRARKLSQPRPAAQVAPAEQTAQPAVVDRRLWNAQDRAERWILGTLLAHPHSWGTIEHQVHAEDFTEDRRRRLAEIYWMHQRDLGEPVFNEFLSELKDASLVELAIELLEEADALPDIDQVLAESIAHLERMRRRREEQKLLAESRRTSDERPDPEQWALLQKMMEKNKPDLTRIGPDLRRGGS